MALPAWSYSSISTYIQCPRKYQAEKVTKEVPYQDTEATLYGKAVHLAAEEFIRDGKPIPPQFAYMQPILDKLVAMPGEKHCEMKVGLAKRDGQLVSCDFFADDVWFRGIADLIIIQGDVARIIDYKTGKSAKYADTKQLALMAACVFLMYPEVKTIKAILLFVVSKEVVKDEYTYDRRFDIFAKLDTPLRQMEASYTTGVWNPKPNGLCSKWCKVVDCAHNGGNNY